MGALSDLLKSEKGLFCGLLAVAGSVLAATGHMSIGEWQTYTTQLAGIYVGGKAIQGVGSAIGKKIDQKAIAKAVSLLRNGLEANDSAADAAAAKLPKGDA